MSIFNNLETLETSGIQTQEDKILSKANYDDLDDNIIADLNNITDKILNENIGDVELSDDGITQNSLEGNLLDNYHNYYINFFHFIQRFLNDNIIGGFDVRRSLKTPEYLKIKDFYLNYGSKTLSSYSYQKSETQLFPYANINIMDIHPFLSVNNIARLKNVGVAGAGNSNVLLASNDTKKEAISISTEQNLINVSVEVLFEDGTSVLDFINIIYNRLPMNFTFYAPEYNNYVNITPLIENWESSDVLNNVIIQPSNTWTNQFFAYAKFTEEVMVELTSVQQTIDKQSMRYSVMLDFIFTMSQPVDLYKHTISSFSKIEILTDVNYSSGVILDPAIISTLDTDSEKFNKVISEVLVKDNIIYAEYLAKPEPHLEYRTKEEVIENPDSTGIYKQFLLIESDYIGLDSINEYIALYAKENSLDDNYYSLESYNNIQQDLEIVLEISSDISKEDFLEIVRLEIFKYLSEEQITSKNLWINTSIKFGDNLRRFILLRTIYLDKLADANLLDNLRILKLKK